MLITLIILIALMIGVIEIITQRYVEKKPASDELKEYLKHKAEENRKDSE
ncbi:Uncharacterised protein [Staphylococcus kloosii]|uniref:Phage protein n=1 Tax=Staphylococcus kloosii TaxID=29384 RepID=A0ABQ0XM93_9STAP|nr:hypothetical protein SKL01_17240 [Staphylococcus kloosii]SUM48849.1 Uncharacterised protein [Staphylococcus kloosii]